MPRERLECKDLLKFKIPLFSQALRGCLSVREKRGGGLVGHASGHKAHPALSPVKLSVELGGGESNHGGTAVRAGKG